MWLYDHASVDRYDLSFPNPIWWRPCADPVQKRVPGEKDVAKRGLTPTGPLQKGGQNRITNRATYVVFDGDFAHAVEGGFIRLGTARARCCAPCAPLCGTPRGPNRSHTAQLTH